MARRIAELGSLWRGPALVVSAMLAATSVVALVQQQEAERRRELVFQSQADQLRQEIVEAIDREGERFRTAVDFAVVTHPSPIDVFHTYFARQHAGSGQDEQSSYNFMLVEGVNTSGFDALTERERRLGNTDFTVRSLSDSEGERLIVTRTAAEARPGELDVTGLDVTGVEEQFPLAIDDNGYSLRILEPGPSFQLLLAVAGPSRSELEAAADDVTGLALLVSPVEPLRPIDQEGLSMTAVRLVPVGELLAPVDRDLAVGLRASLEVESLEAPLVVIAGADEQSSGPVDLTANYDLSTDHQRWRLVITAREGYGPPTGLFEQVGTWAFGLTTAILAALIVLARSWHRRRLVRAEQELASALTVASTDGLTGLLNRVGFLQRSGGLDPEQQATLLFIDLDGFKSVNDLDGHEAGDRVLQSVAETLLASTRAGDLVSRMGGDEFVVYLPGLADQGLVAHMVSRLIDAIDGVDRRITCSVGVAIRSNLEATSVDDLLRRADAAMYKVKRGGGRGYHLAVGPVDAGSAGRSGPGARDGSPTPVG